MTLTHKQRRALLLCCFAALLPCCLAARSARLRAAELEPVCVRDARLLCCFVWLVVVLLTRTVKVPLPNGCILMTLEGNANYFKDLQMFCH